MALLGRVSAFRMLLRGAIALLTNISGVQSS